MIETSGRTDETFPVSDIGSFLTSLEILPAHQTDRHISENEVGSVKVIEKEPCLTSRDVRCAKAVDAIARQNYQPPLGNFFHLEQVGRSRNP
jgi:hypothetical protein